MSPCIYPTASKTGAKFFESYYMILFGALYSNISQVNGKLMSQPHWINFESYIQRVVCTILKNTQKMHSKRKVGNLACRGPYIHYL